MRGVIDRFESGRNDERNRYFRPPLNEKITRDKSMSNDALQTSQSVWAVQSWQSAANEQNVDQLLAVSDENIEIVGPRGVASGHQILRDWLARAGLTLETRRFFARGDAVVAAQHGVWRDVDTGDVKGEADVASSFRVVNGRVTRFARFDDLGSALADAGLTEADVIEH
jgi:hypothetical protein